MSDELVNLFASMFIARPDVKAIQRADGSYTPVQHYGEDKSTPIREPWQREDIEAHLAGDKTFGHYLVSTDDKCKIFCFDIDLEQTGFLPTEYDEFGVPGAFQPVTDLRGAWHDRENIGRKFMKIQFQELAHRLAAGILTNLEIPVAVAYSGNKGVHVYGFTGLMDAADVRDGAKVVLDALGCFVLKTDKPNNQHFYQHTNADPVDGFPNLSVELYPKQDSLGGKDLGNLLRLPLGVNTKHTDPTFFMDMTAPLGAMKPIDPVAALTAANPFESL